MYNRNWYIIQLRNYITGAKVDCYIDTDKEDFTDYNKFSMIIEYLYKRALQYNRYNTIFRNLQIIIYKNYNDTKSFCDDDDFREVYLQSFNSDLHFIKNDVSAETYEHKVLATLLYNVLSEFKKENK